MSNHRPKYRSITVTSVLLVLWTAHAAHALPRGYITGTVRDATGAALERVRVTFRGPVTRVVETDPAGRFAAEIFRRATTSCAPRGLDSRRRRAAFTSPPAKASPCH